MEEYKAYVCSLDKKSLKKAKDELFENEEDRLAAVEAFRDWIKVQPHIKCPKVDIITLLTFLRWAKFSQIRARERFESYLTMRNYAPFSYIDVQDSLTREIIKSGYALVPPNRLPDGTQLLIMSAGSMAKYSIEQLLKISYIATEYCCQSEMTQVNGVTFLVDYTDFKWKYMDKLFSQETQKLIKVWMNNMPGRWKKMYWYRPGILIEALMAFVKPIFPKKLVSRITAHETMESIYPHIPKECLPSEYLPDDYTGPNVGSMTDSAEAFLSVVSQKDFRDNMLYNTSDAFGVDMTKKTQDDATGYFRKLNVD